MRSVAAKLNALAPAAPVVLRLVLGAVMGYHGYQKLVGGPANFGNGMLGGMLGLPAPVFFGWVVTLVELVGGVMLILGLLTRLVALADIVLLTVATLTVKTGLGLIAPGGAMLPGAELDLALIAGFVGLLLLGPGRLSLDAALGLEPTSQTPEPVATVA